MRGHNETATVAAHSTPVSIPTDPARDLEAVSVGASLALRPLYPESHPTEHKVYLDALELAFKDAQVRNIALTGSYGSGKSSVLKDFLNGKQSRAILISFSTLGAQIPDYETGQISTAHADHGQAETSNLIQKEIVKQILYRERYDDVPASRYPHIYNVAFGRIFLTSLAISVGSFLVLWGFRLVSVTTFTPIQGGVMAALLYLIIVWATDEVLPLLNRIGVEKINGGPVSLTLSGSTNYFDQYLDEIMYFFEATKCDIVIIEDLDRFNNPYIFETLRQLNNLLNNSKQINQTVRFVYAVKDSIFGVGSDSPSNENDWNRTKFFDLIIPMVPFVTYKNSRDVMAGMFVESFGVTREAVGIVSRYITDMRFINNVNNEFQIFRKVIFEASNIKGLDKSNLFAVVVYKNKYLEDFELLKTGNSMLDSVYFAARSFINDRVAKLNRQITIANKRIDEVDSAETLGAEYGTKLIAAIHEIVDNHNSYLENVQFKGKSYAKSDELRSKMLWSDIADASPTEALNITFKSRTQQYGQIFSDTMSIQKVRDLVNDDLDFNKWDDEAIKSLRGQIKDGESQVGAVRGKSIKALAFESKEFSEKIKEITGAGLLYDLIIAGLIDEHYALYTSVYREESVSANGMTFIIRSIRDGHQDFLYKFVDDDEIKHILAELDDIDYEDRKIYNVDILSYLLRKGDRHLNVVAGNLLAGTVNDNEFLTAYIRNSDHADLLFEKLTRVWPDVFQFIVTNDGLEKSIKLHLFQVATENSSEKMKYRGSDAIKNFISDNASAIPSMKELANNDCTPKIQNLLELFDVRLEVIDPIKNPSLLSYIVERNLYQLNVANMTKIVGGADLALDVIKSVSSRLFERTCSELDGYVQIIGNSDGTSHSINAGASFVEILNVISNQAKEPVNSVIAEASPECVIDDLSSVPTVLWSALFSKLRIKNTIHNCLTYFAEAKNTVDDAMLSYLDSVDSLENDSTEEDAAKATFAVAVLGSRAQVQKKASIVSDLGLASYIGVNEFAKEDSELYGALVKRNIIDDSEVTFNELSGLTWPTKEAYITRAPKFLEYLGNLNLTSEDINGIMESAHVNNDIKNYIVTNLAAYKEVISTDATQRAAAFALERQIGLGVAPLSIMLESVDVSNGVNLLLHSLEKVSRSDLLVLLPIIGGEYAKLAQPNKRPSLTVNSQNETLVKHLKDVGIVSSFASRNGKLNVNVKNSL